MPTSASSAIQSRSGVQRQAAATRGEREQRGRDAPHAAGDRFARVEAARIRRRALRDPPAVPGRRPRSRERARRSPATRRGSIGSSVRPGRCSASIALIRLPACARFQQRPLRRRCRDARPAGGCAAPRSRVRMRGSPRASMTMLHSVSKPIERLLKLADPTLRSSSSTTSTLLCTLRDSAARARHIWIERHSAPFASAAFSSRVQTIAQYSHRALFEPAFFGAARYGDDVRPIGLAQPLLQRTAHDARGEILVLQIDRTCRRADRIDIEMTNLLDRLTRRVARIGAVGFGTTRCSTSRLPRTAEQFPYAEARSTFSPT